MKHGSAFFLSNLLSRAFARFPTFPSSARGEAYFLHYLYQRWNVERLKAAPPWKHVGQRCRDHTRLPKALLHVG